MHSNKRALLIGINYVDDPKSALRGCVNDVMNVRKFLQTKMGFSEEHISTYVDTDPATKKYTTAQGILSALHDIVLKSWTENLEFVWIHYSGHGTHVRDTSGDEADGRDECLCPSDYSRAGVILDDWIREIFKGFNPETKVMCVFDCCHSGSIADLKYRYTGKDRFVEETTETPIAAKIMTLSGCSDDQVSADAYNVLGKRTFTGALTSCMLTLLEKEKNGLGLFRSKPFEFLEALRHLLRAKGFPQYPQLCTSYKIFEEQPLW
jgi:metacaspase-1